MAVLATIAGPGTHGLWGYAVEIASMFVTLSRDVGAVRVATLLLVASALAGAALGALSWVLRVRRAWRVIVLVAAAVAGLYVPVWTATALDLLTESAPPSNPFLALLGVSAFAAYGLLMVGPVLVPGAILAAVLLERWTRPDALTR